jgi:hypothetical protein
MFAQELAREGMRATVHFTIGPKCILIRRTFLHVDWRKLQFNLTPRSWALLQKPQIAQLLENFPKFYGTRKFILVFTRALYSSVSWARSIQSIPHHPISLRSILISLTHAPPSSMQLKNVHSLSSIYNDIRITATATYFGPTWPSSDNCSLFENRTALDLKSMCFHAVAHRCSHENTIMCPGFRD